MNICHELQRRFAAGLAGLTDEPGKYSLLVKPAQDARHGDYQANCAMPLAKAQGKPPREVAQVLVDRLDRGDLLEPPEIAGAGFINLRLRTDWLAAQLQAMARDDRLGVAPAAPPRTFVIDFSSPNVAKPLHVGHLRSTIIGDALARLLRFLGHTVVTDNHLGDWGLQFGILLYGYKTFLDRQAFEADPVAELARLYKKVNDQFKKKKKDEDEEDEEGGGDPVKDACRAETAKLHAGDPENLALWQQFMPHCLEEIDGIYRRLDVRFDHTHGESFYQPMLCHVVRDLCEKALAVESQGAFAIFFGEGEPPALVQNSSGAFTYTTSDLATVRYRVETWKPDAVLYVVDSRQALHFKNLFAAARRWGYDRVALEHVSFGSVLGPDGKPLKTREGNATLLHELLDHAIAAAATVYERLRQEAVERGVEVPTFTEQELQAIHQAVGVGAVKYADLSQNRTSDYKFDTAKMTATEGNTATYMQYAYARNRSIIREGEVDETELRANPPAPELGTPHERGLALMLLRFGEALESAAADYRPNLITAYLWDLAKAYSGFYQNCPVLKAPTPELRRGRLLLCDLTARVIGQGLELLGIRTIERM
jgi:arginyl-tRNA synthetase